MKTKLKIILLFTIMVVSSIPSNAQKKLLINNEAEIVAAAKKHLDKAMQDGSQLQLFATENQFSGTYTFDITIRNKGEVASVFVVGNDGGNIPTQNKLKDYVKAMDMGFKMPKNKSYKFQYIFKF